MDGRSLWSKGIYYRSAMVLFRLALDLISGIMVR
jgi:hypothetical protein